MHDPTVLLPFGVLVYVAWELTTGIRHEYRRVRIGRRLGLL